MKSTLEVLEGQPDSVRRMTQKERDQIVISSMLDDNGNDVVLSRMGDASWNLRPFFHQSNVSEGGKSVHWDHDLPMDLINDCKAVAYAWYKRGTPRSRPPIARGITKLASASIMPFVRWLNAFEVSRFSDVRKVHISNYVYHCKHERNITPSALYGRLRIIELIRVFAFEMIHPLRFDPWGDSSFGRICGKVVSRSSGTQHRNTGRTGIIPPSDQALIFNYCEKILTEAKARIVGMGLNYQPSDDVAYIRIRDAVLYVVSITSGMRNDEVIGIEAYKWRRDYKNGVLFCWISTVEHKTGKGQVEYLVPELTLDALELLVVYARKIKAQLADEVRRLESSLNPVDPILHSLRLKKARRDASKMFLGIQNEFGKSGAKVVGALSGGASNLAFDRLAKAAGSDWPLRTHQCRRTYARCFVESRMGRASLVWIKWQFKHSTMSMSQLYASNPLQDAKLFDEIFQQMGEYKIDLVESWLKDQPLAGGAGKKIVELRAIPVKNRLALLEQTVPQANIRATGHGWCIAIERGCGGAGLYEATRCPGCKNSVIDGVFAATWKEIYDQQKELLQIPDAGPAVIQRAERDLKVALDVIVGLGIDPSGGALEA